MRGVFSTTYRGSSKSNSTDWARVTSCTLC